MKKFHTRSLRFQTVLTSVALILGSFALTAFFVLKNEIKQGNIQLDYALNLTADKKMLELNASFTATEKAVLSSRDYILRTIDEERILRDAKYEKAYMDDLKKEMSTLASLSPDIMTLYFRMNIDRFGGMRGIFQEKQAESGFLSIKPTDIKKYSVTDTEHVGWYYEPIWAKKPIWTAPYDNQNIGTQMISFIAPIYRKGLLLGIVGMDIKLASIKNIIDSLPLEDQVCILLGKNKAIVYYNNAHTNSGPSGNVEQSAEVSLITEAFSENKADSIQKFRWKSLMHWGVMRHLENDMSIVLGVSENAMKRAFKTIISPLWISLSIAVAFTAILLWLALWRIIMPIKKITEATHKLSRGELGIKINYHSKNELGKLSENISMMTSQMQEYINHIREQTKNERAAKERAEAASQSKSEFLSSLYLIMQEIDLAENTLKLVQARDNPGNDEQEVIGNADEVLKQVMQKTATDSSLDTLLPFVNLSTLQERMGNRTTIAQEFQGFGGIWCRGRFIAMDKNPDGKLRHVLWAVENINDERKERDRLEGEVAKSVAASEAKSAFLANMSHEIRTPINAVLGMNEMILRECEDNEILGYASNIKTAGNNLLSIVNDILDFSKIEAGKMELIPENYDISSVVVDLVNMISDRAHKKDLEFILKADPKLPRTLFGDSVRIKQCILNLLTNAVKYTKEGKVTFTVGFEKIDDAQISLLVSVEDTGIGIKEEDMLKLFSPFERLEEDKNKTIEGTGLGISIVVKMLRMMGTKLDVKSEYGKGSVFSFAVKQMVTDWAETGDINESYKESISKIGAYKEKLHAPKARLLFVDDTEMNLEVIQGLLKKTGIRLDMALSGMAALEKVLENSYDIIFIDHRMPGMDGIQTLHAMQTMEGNKNAGKPCIALTANAIAGVKQMYIDEGFTDYLSKPVDPDKLEAMIRKYLPPEYIEEPPESEDDDSGESSESKLSGELLSKLSSIEGIEVETALKNCGTAEVLQNTIIKYYTTIESKAEELNQLFEAGDTENYGTKVHALKSTSRLIGAMALASQAEYLEHAADKAFAGDKAALEEIKAKHKPLIEHLLGYREKLAPFAAALEEQKAAEESTKAEITEDELKEKMTKLSQAAEDFDIDSLDAIVAELSKVRLPDSFIETFKKIRTSVENVDFNELKDLLKAEGFSE